MKMLHMLSWNYFTPLCPNFGMDVLECRSCHFRVDFCFETKGVKNLTSLLETMIITSRECCVWGMKCKGAHSLLFLRFRLSTVLENVQKPLHWSWANKFQPCFWQSSQPFCTGRRASCCHKWVSCCGKWRWPCNLANCGFLLAPYI